MTGRWVAVSATQHAIHLAMIADRKCDATHANAARAGVATHKATAARLGHQTARSEIDMGIEAHHDSDPAAATAGATNVEALPATASTMKIVGDTKKIAAVDQTAGAAVIAVDKQRATRARANGLGRR